MKIKSSPSYGILKTRVEGGLEIKSRLEEEIQTIRLVKIVGEDEFV